MRMFTWADITHFKPSEFDSPDLPGSGERNMHLDFVYRVNAMRDMIGRPLRITSGFRTPAHNVKVGGAKNSAHLRGLAVDLYTGDDSGLRFAILQAAFAMNFKRIEIAPAHIHVDDDGSLPQKVAIFLASYK